jgi:hypothetical protein
VYSLKSGDGTVFAIDSEADNERPDERVISVVLLHWTISRSRAMSIFETWKSVGIV